MEPTMTVQYCKARTNSDLWHPSHCSRKATTPGGFCKQHDPERKKAKEDAERARNAPLNAALKAHYDASTALTAYRGKLDTALRMAKPYEFREQTTEFAEDLLKLRELLLAMDATQERVKQERANLTTALKGGR